MRKAIAVGCIAMALGCAEHREYRQQPYQPVQAVTKSEPVRLPHCLDSILADDGEKLILVDKSRFRVSLYIMQGRWREEAGYPASFGMAKGQKTKEGDRKTPEGHYKIASKLATYGEFSSEYLLRLNRARIDGRTGAYGDHALLLDYPNSLDRFLRRTGSGIMLHETQPDKIGRSSTRGCIGLLPGEMAELFKAVSVGASVVIVPDCHY